MAFPTARGCCRYMKTVKLCAKTTRYFNNRYYKNYYATIPRNFIESLSLQAGDELSVEKRDQSIILTRVDNIAIAAAHVSKDTFKRMIVRELTKGPKSWSELRQRTRLHFKRPPPQWVRELRAEYGIEITYDDIGHRMLWRIMEPATPMEELVGSNDFAKNERLRNAAG